MKRQPNEEEKLMQMIHTMSEDPSCEKNLYPYLEEIDQVGDVKVPEGAGKRISDMTFSRLNLERPNQKMGLFRFWQPVFAVLIVVLVLTATVLAKALLYKDSLTYAFVTVDINPSLEFQIDRENKIISSNQFESAAIGSTEPFGLEGMLLTDGIKKVMQQHEKDISKMEKSMPGFLVALSPKNPKDFNSSQFEALCRKVDSTLKSHKTYPRVLKIESPEYQTAKNLNISAGRYHYYLLAKEKRLFLSLDDAKYQNIILLMDEVENGKKDEQDEGLFTPAPITPSKSQSPAPSITPAPGQLTPGRTPDAGTIGAPINEPSAYPHTITVATSDQLRQALQAAKPGTQIVLNKGDYRLAGKPLETLIAGEATAPIKITGADYLQSKLILEGAQEAFLINQPYYILENIFIDVSGTGAQYGIRFTSRGHHGVIQKSKFYMSAQSSGGILIESSGSPPHPDDGKVISSEFRFVSQGTGGNIFGIHAVGVKGWQVKSSKFVSIRSANSSQPGTAVSFTGNSQDTRIEGNLFDYNDLGILLGKEADQAQYRNQDTAYRHQRGLIQNNLCIGTTQSGFSITATNSTKIVHNSIYNTWNSKRLSAIDISLQNKGVEIISNVLDGSIRNLQGGQHQASTNYSLVIPDDFLALTDLTKRDLRPKPGTAFYNAVVDKASPVEGLTDDYLKNKRPLGNGGDIGAYELN